VFAYAISHEAAHDEYFSLSKKDQTALNDLFIFSDKLQILTKKFTNALYSNKTNNNGGSTVGEGYMNAHLVRDDVASVNMRTNDGQKGLKDFRSLIIKFNGEEKNVFLGLIVTEFISHMAANALSDKVWEKISERRKNKTGSYDPIYDVTKQAFDVIQNDKILKASFDKFQIYKNNNQTFLKAFSGTI